jgi:hypothetical protein
MHDDIRAFGDPLRFIDPRYEPRDPLFDCEESDLPPANGRKRRRALVAVASGDPVDRSME